MEQATNFISSQVVSALGLYADINRQFRVHLGDGHTISTRGKCGAFILKLEDIDFSINAHVLDLGAIDLILGVTWLRSLDQVLMNWRTMSMSFLLQDKQVTLHGLRPKGAKMQNSKEGLLQNITLFSVTTDSPMMIDGCLWQSHLYVTAVQGLELSLEQQPQLQKVLQDYPEVFNEKIGFNSQKDN